MQQRVRLQTACCAAHPPRHSVCAGPAYILLTGRRICARRSTGAACGKAQSTHADSERCSNSDQIGFLRPAVQGLKGGISCAWDVKRANTLANMGRARKPFIDKKRSTTYNLIYRAGEVEVDGEEAEQPQRQLVDARLGIGIGRPDEESVSAAQSRQLDAHPLLWLEVNPPPPPRADPLPSPSLSAVPPERLIGGHALLICP